MNETLGNQARPSTATTFRSTNGALSRQCNWGLTLETRSVAGSDPGVGGSVTQAFDVRETGIRLHTYRPIIASTSAFRKRSTSSMNAIDGTSSSRAVIDAIW